MNKQKLQAQEEIDVNPEGWAAVPHQLRDQAEGADRMNIEAAADNLLAANDVQDPIRPINPQRLQEILAHAPQVLARLQQALIEEERNEEELQAGIPEENEEDAVDNNSVVIYEDEQVQINGDIPPLYHKG